MLLTKEKKREFENDVFVKLMKQDQLAEKYWVCRHTIRRYLLRTYGVNWKTIKRKRNGTTTK